MEHFSAAVINGQGSPPPRARWIPVGMMLAAAAVALFGRPPQARASEFGPFPSAGRPAVRGQTLETHAALRGGHGSAWRPGYPPQDRHGAGPVDDPASGIRAPRFDAAPGAVPGRGRDGARLTLQEKFRVYLVQQGDSLWTIARRFNMGHRTLAAVNGLSTGAILQVGRPLKVKVAAWRELRLNLPSSALARHPSLLEHIRMIDGRPAPPWLVTDYAADIIGKRSPGEAQRGWGSRRRNLTIVIRFQLVRNLLEGRARQYHPIVLTHAQKFNLDPALIMAMIHTESAFNPNARSKASAYGLMQLVPHTAGREAYYRIYGQRRELTPAYLFDPHNNIELGTAYLHILKNGYLGAITDPLSRTYCAVAAYHAGPSSVWRAFIAEPSIREATAVINRLRPADVYQRLVEALPSVESRNYLRDVMKRVGRYGGGYGQNGATRT